MRHYEPFKPSGLSFAENAGSPDELSAALGLLVVSFNELEETVSVALSRELCVDAEMGRAVAGELPFRARLNVLGMVAGQRSSTQCSRQPEDAADRLNDLLTLCRAAENLRNQYVHSFWPASRNTGTRGVRTKRSVRARGLLQTQQEVEGGQVLDVADYIAYACTMVEQFFNLPMGAADA